MHRLRIALIVMSCLPLFGCFEDPIREHVHLSLRGSGATIVTVVQEVADPRMAQNNAELADRMEETRITIESSLDLWSRRFALQQPLAEQQSIQRVEGKLRRSVHSAVLTSFEDALEMVEADGLTGGLVVAGGIAEVSFFPTGGSRATYTQRQEAERLLAEWSETLTEYFESVIDLYSYLESRPDRAVPCFAHIFDKHDGVAASGPLEAEEEELVRSVKDALDSVVLALLVPDGEAFSMNELTRLVYDPFPARLTMSVDGHALKSEGWIVARRVLRAARGGRVERSPVTRRPLDVAGPGHRPGVAGARGPAARNGSGRVRFPSALCGCRPDIRGRGISSALRACTHR